MPADFEPVQRSLLGLMFMALSPWYLVLLLLAGLLSFVFALMIVLRGNGPMAVAALMLVVHIPFLIGVFAALQGAIVSYSVVAMSPVAPKPADVAVGISTALFAPVAGMLLMVPGYATAALGALLRSFRADSRSVPESTGLTGV